MQYLITMSSAIILTGGLLLTKLTRFGDLVVGISLTVCALLCAAIAYTPYVEVMFVEFVLQGTAETFIAIGKFRIKILLCGMVKRNQF